MNTLSPKNLVISYRDLDSVDRFTRFQISGFNQEKSSSLAFEKIDPKYGEVIGVMSEAELNLTLNSYSYYSMESTKEIVAMVRQAYETARQNNFLTVQSYEADGRTFTALSMQKNKDFYRVVFGGKGNAQYLINGTPMNDEQKLDLFRTAQAVLGTKGMDRFGLTGERNKVIDASKGTVMIHALNPVAHFGPECAVRTYES